MAYISSIREKSYKLEADENDQPRQIVLDSIPLSIDWCQIAPLAADAKGHVAQGGRYTLLMGGKSYEVFARLLTREDEEEGLTYEVLVADQRFEVHVEDERERALIGSLKSSQTTGEITVRAPMPGLVLNVLKEVGARVERGEIVAVLEAMKMENDLAAPHGGTTKEVRVGKGQTVNQGDILLIITSD
jgi:biotin carboxyl carrier protein